MATARSQAFSLGLHVLLALLLLATSLPIQPAAPLHVTPLTFFRPRKAPESRSGGSNRSALPARHGSPPPQAHRTFIPPTASDHPTIALPITIAFDIPLVNTSANLGDPYSPLTKGAFGNDGDNGIGESPSGPPGIGVHRAPGVTPPQLIYKVEPEFSEEARSGRQRPRSQRPCSPEPGVAAG
jgi:protein TonB